MRQGLAQGTGLADAQFVTGEDTRRRQNLGAFTAGQRAGGDDDFRQRIGGMEGRGVGGAGEEHGARQRGTLEWHGIS